MSPEYYPNTKPSVLSLSGRRVLAYIVRGICGTVVLSASKSTASNQHVVCVCVRRVSAEEEQSPLNVYDTINGDGVHLVDNYL